MSNQVQETLIKRKFYHSPEIIHEFELETRAGSPLGGGRISVDDVIIGISPDPNEGFSTKDQSP